MLEGQAGRNRTTVQREPALGLDVAEAIGDAIGADVPVRVRTLAEGALGKKAGRGFYDYG